MEDLSQDELKSIFKFVPPEGTLIIALVCKDFNEVLLEENKDLTASLKYLTSSLDLLKYVINLVDKLNNNFCKYAIKNGNLECLTYLHENGYLWNEDDGTNIYFVIATLNGHLDCLKYLYENGYNCDASPSKRDYLCDIAAEDGYLDCLKYLHEIGCHWDEETFRLASRYGHLKCIKYLHENNCPIDINCIRCAKNQDVIDYINSLCKN